MADDKEHPEIPSFKPAKQGEKKTSGLTGLGKTPASKPPSSGIKWPSNLGSKGSPNPKLKVRGLPGGATLIDRLKNLRRKDLGFIAAGLSVLMMAPLAEHFMMTPQDETGNLTGGFDQKGPLFPDGTTIYETGGSNLAPGGLLGAGQDVITPLNVRDPSALVMGPGASQKPAATETPAAPPADSSWKDALSQAASRGAKTAVKNAKLPKPNVKMAGALRGLSSLAGSSHGGGSTYTPPPLSAQGVPNRAAPSNSLTRSQAIPGYQGAARRSGSSSGSPESLRSSGGRQGDIFNRGGATTALDNASQSAIPGGGAGFGGGGPNEGKGDKGPGGNSTKESKSLGESLEFMRLKMEQEKAITLKWKRKEWETFGKKKMIEEAVYKSAIENLLGKGIFEPMGKAIAGAVGLMNPDPTASSGVQCTLAPGGTTIFLANTDDGTWSCGGDAASGFFAACTPKDPTKSCGGERKCPGGCGYKGAPKDGGPAGSAEPTQQSPSNITQDGLTGTAGAEEESTAAAGTWQDAVADLGSAQSKLSTLLRANTKPTEDPGKSLYEAAETLVGQMETAKKLHDEAIGLNLKANNQIKVANGDLDKALTTLGGAAGAKNPGGRIGDEQEVAGKAKSVLGKLKIDDFENGFGVPAATADKDAMLAKSGKSGDQGVDSFKTLEDTLKTVETTKLGVKEGVAAESAQKHYDDAAKKVGEATQMKSEFDAQKSIVISKGVNARGDMSKIVEQVTNGDTALTAAKNKADIALGKTEASLGASRKTLADTRLADTAVLLGSTENPGGQKLTGYKTTGAETTKETEAAYKAFEGRKKAYDAWQKETDAAQKSALEEAYKATKTPAETALTTANAAYAKTETGMKKVVGVYEGARTSHGKKQK